jgi:diketogulonate reductase-like aldo/keto reductase
MHTPFAFQPGDDMDPRDEKDNVIYDNGVTLMETWAAMERLVDSGKCKNIGLSDVTLKDVQEVVASARIKPAVVEVECHPYLPEWELFEYCQQNGIILLAFAALGHGLQPNVLEDPIIVDIARRLEMTPAQVALSWSAQRGVAFLTTSTTRAHIQENFELATLPDWAMRDMKEKITTRKRLNPVVETGVPGFFR